MADGTDRGRLALIVGTIVLALVAIVFPNWRDLLNAINSGDARVLAASIYGAFTLVGILLSTALNSLLGKRNEKKEKARIATALLTEIYLHGTVVERCSNVVESARTREWPLKRSELSVLLPPPPVMFPALASKVSVFSQTEISNIILCYGSLERAERACDLLPISLEGATVQGADGIWKPLVPGPALHDLSIISAAWRDAARCVALAMQCLRPYATATTPKDGQNYSDLLVRLVRIATADSSYGANKSKTEVVQ